MKSLHGNLGSDQRELLPLGATGVLLGLQDRFEQAALCGRSDQVIAMILPGLKICEFASAQTHHGCSGSTLIFQKGFFVLARIFIQD